MSSWSRSIWPFLATKHWQSMCKNGHFYLFLILLKQNLWKSFFFSIEQIQTVLQWILIVYAIIRDDFLKFWTFQINSRIWPVLPFCHCNMNNKAYFSHFLKVCSSRFFFRTEQMQDRCGMYDTKEEKTLFSFRIITKIAGYVLLVCLTIAYPP